MRSGWIGARSRPPAALDSYQVVRIRYQESVGSAETTMQSLELLPKSIDLLTQRNLRLAEPDTHSELELAVEFGHRAQGDLKETSKLAGRSPARAFCDVRAHRHGSRSHLRSEAEAFRARKVRGQLIDRLRNLNAVAPYVQSTRIVHPPTDTPFGGLLELRRTCYLLPAACCPSPSRYVQ